jgi:lactoylglutathione lyase
VSVGPSVRGVLSIIGGWAWLAGAVAGQGPAVAPAATRPPIVGLSHLTLQVSDLKAARAYYHGLLGFDEPFRVAGTPGGPDYAYFRINDYQYVELVSGLDARGDDREAHLAYRVTDAEGMRVYLAGRGVAVPSAVGTDRLGNLSFAVRDPEDRIVEFVQDLPGSRLSHSRGRPPLARQLSARAFHAAIPVIDLDATIGFYAGILGFSEMLRASEQNPAWINYRLPEAAVYIEWTLMARDSSRADRARKHHLGLAVPDVQAAADALRERASEMGISVSPAIVLGKNRRWHVGVADPDNRRHELMEPYTVK